MGDGTIYLILIIGFACLIFFSKDLFSQNSMHTLLSIVWSVRKNFDFSLFFPFCFALLFLVILDIFS